MMNRHFLIALTTTIVLALLILFSNTTVLSYFGGTINSPQTSTSDVSVSEGNGDDDATLSTGTTDIIGAATTTGRFIVDVYAFSDDELCSVFIPSGTIGLTRDSKALTQITISPDTVPREPPENSSFIGTIYKIGPEGTRFDPTISVSFVYDLDKLPPGAEEKDLTIAMYNKSTSSWVILKNIKVNNTTYTITGETNYLATFSIIAYRT